MKTRTRSWRYCLRATTPHGQAAARLGIETLVASVDSSGRTSLSKDGRALSGRRDVEGPSADDVALFLHTSGTTSRPKGVPLTHGNLAASLRNIGDTYALTPDDVAMVVMPLFHVHGLIGVALFDSEQLGAASCFRRGSARADSGVSSAPAGRRGTRRCRPSTRYC